MLKNRIFTILLMIILCMPVIAEPETTEAAIPLTPISQEAPLGSTAETTEETLPEADIIPYKQPAGKRKIAKKFLLAMSGVAISSILLYVILTIYNKIREGIIETAKEIPPEGETSLVTPDNLTDAVKVFIEKTKWDN